MGVLSRVRNPDLKFKRSLKRLDFKFFSNISKVIVFREISI